MKAKRKIPSTKALWLPEIEAAYKDAKAAIPFGYAVGSKITEHDLFQMAPSVCLKFRGIKNTETTRKKATDAALTSYVANKDMNPILIDPHMAFAFCYILSHYGLELIGEAEGEELLCYIEDNLEKIKSGESSIYF
ncbi:hypothetical protein [Parendozoicomonas sp. Alg238-R29]|uniref:hypothetical protein n=1 Tax=Parendozoicomonas sp. Alg238-R29 TaxID=2993446 RepID=UPI00248E2F5C|nr:hypothetical protein [Parendozoicomonas sp. Alg238-R29]